MAASLGYDAGLLSLGALKDASVDELIVHCRAVADTIPVFGFYLNEAVGGRLLSLEFWQRFVEIPNVVAIKIAAFNRYQTFDVYVPSPKLVGQGTLPSTQVMMTTFCSILSPNTRSLLLQESRNYIFLEVFSVIGRSGRRAPSPCSKKPKIPRRETDIPQNYLTKAIEVTDANAVLFDAANHFVGCIPGIHDVLHRQGLLEGTWCLDPDEVLSVGQDSEIDRICEAYPYMRDDKFIAENLDRWLS